MRKTADRPTVSRNAPVDPALIILLDPEQHL